MPSQVDNGKAFEYAIAKTYFDYLVSLGVNVEFQHDEPWINAQRCFEFQALDSQQGFCRAAEKTIETLVAIEPGLVSSKNAQDILKLRIASDVEGIAGDVRDVIFYRNNWTIWELGISAKNNHDAVKHSRLSQTIDFGREWLNLGCSDAYFSEIRPIFDRLARIKATQPQLEWTDLGEQKSTEIYVPLLNAFRKEMLALARNNREATANLLCYLIGRKPFYKIIKEDKNNIVVVKAFNIDGKLNKTVNGQKPVIKTEAINLPTRIIELEFKPGSDTTLMMVLDEGWQISFRLHNASKHIEPSLKFDINLIGNPPILFTQHLF